ncbi:hypothetical protein [Modestobacter sp. I12A-02662]|uniref:hypothetical protein n=1 Tax=Modestobacter sp. I12A-02662 TaxID=1730496 RepID=UPI0034DE36D1
MTEGMPPPWGRNIFDGAEMTAVTLVDAWAGEVRRLVPEVHELREWYVQGQMRFDEGDEETLTEHQLYVGWIRLWAAQHHLVWAAYQLERWVARLARERGTTAPAIDPVLADLRHALEHLDEAVLDDGGFMTPGERSRSLRRLPGARLQIDTSHSLAFFDVIDAEDLERRALSIMTTSDWLMQRAAEDWAEQQRPDEQGPADEDGQVL